MFNNYGEFRAWTLPGLAKLIFYLLAEKWCRELPVFEWDRNALERRSGPFKTIRLMVKFYQAYVLASEGLAR